MDGGIGMARRVKSPEEIAARERLGHIFDEQLRLLGRSISDERRAAIEELRSRFVRLAYRKGATGRLVTPHITHGIDKQGREALCILLLGSTGDAHANPYWIPFD